MIEAEDMELKGLRLELVDLVNDYTNAGTGYIPYMYSYEEDIKALVNLPYTEQRKHLEVIAKEVISSYIK